MYRQATPGGAGSAPGGVARQFAVWGLTVLFAGVLGASVGLVVFGAVADAGTRFGVAAVVTFLPVAALAALFWCVPETMGREPEDLWPAG